MPVLLSLTETKRLPHSLSCCRSLEILFALITTLKLWQLLDLQLDLVIECIVKESGRLLCQKFGVFFFFNSFDNSISVQLASFVILGISVYTFGNISFTRQPVESCTQKGSGPLTPSAPLSPQGLCPARLIAPSSLHERESGERAGEGGTSFLQPLQTLRLAFLFNCYKNSEKMAVLCIF